MDDDVIHELRKYYLLMDIWSALKEKFEGISTTKFRTLTIKFDTFKKRSNH